jgi:hypothetical protein
MFLTLLYRFRWVFCQLDALQHCFPPNLRQYLNELPESLDETYERILKGINKAQKDNAHRLLQCLTVAVRPLRVEELAELLAFDFQGSSSGGIPTLKEDWRWDDEEEAVLSTCSSLITIIPHGDSQVVQFSHFSVKEFLTSSRLAQSPYGEVSRFYIDLEPAHTIMVQACLATLLRLDEPPGKSDAKWSPLVKYAAQHWVDHAQFGKVSSRVRDGIDDLFDSSKPYFAAWVQVHDIDEPWSVFSLFQDGHVVGSPLYYAALCGFYDLAERLIMKHPEQVNARGGRNLFPLPAALYKRHFHIADLLPSTVRSWMFKAIDKFTPLHRGVSCGQKSISCGGYSITAQTKMVSHVTAGHRCIVATLNLHLEASRGPTRTQCRHQLTDFRGETPLYGAMESCGDSLEGEVVPIVRQLLEHGADPNIPDNKYKTALHEASSRGWLDVARLLLSYGAKVDENCKTPFQLPRPKEATK